MQFGLVVLGFGATGMAVGFVAATILAETFRCLLLPRALRQRVVVPVLPAPFRDDAAFGRERLGERRRAT